MLKTSTIVCAIDVSAASRKSLPLAVKLARDLEARLVLVNPVSVHNWSIYTIMTYNPKREAAEAAGRVERFVREIMCHAPEVKWELRVEAGDAAAIIEAVAVESGAALVLSARRRGRLEVLKSSPEAGPADDVLKTPEQENPLFRTTAAAGESHQAAVASY